MYYKEKIKFILHYFTMFNPFLLIEGHVQFILNYYLPPLAQSHSILVVALTSLYLKCLYLSFEFKIKKKKTCDIFDFILKKSCCEQFSKF